jgi:hypothetical protein
MFNGGMSTTGGQPRHSDPPRRSRAWIGWLVVIALLLSAGAIAWWLATRDTAEPTPTPSPSVTQSPSVAPSPSASPSVTPSVTPSPSPTPTTADLSDVNGRWCDADGTTGCATIDLPTVVLDDDDTTWYLYPPGADYGEDPSTFDYDVPPNEGDCWVGTVDQFPSEGGASFIYCPTGAVSGLDWVDKGDSSQDRVFITQDVTDDPYLRAD